MINLDIQIIYRALKKETSGCIIKADLNFSDDRFK